MTYETLQYVDSTGATQEIALGLVNIAQTPAATVRMTPASHGPGTFVIAWNQPPELGLDIPFKSRCIVWANRVSTTGANNTFSAGSVIFIGRRTDNGPGRGSVSSSRVQSTIQIFDFLWDLSKITLQQQCAEITGGTIMAPTYTPFYFPDVVLFQPTAGETYSPAPVQGTITTWQQIMDILNYALGYATGANAVQFQFSTTPEFTPVYRNWYPMRSAKCLEAILNCLRTHPGVFTEVDYTTTDGSGNPLPTLHCRNRGSMTALTLPYASTDANGVVHLSSEPQSLPELIPDNVRLYYRNNGTFNGQPCITPGEDFYPSGANSLLNQDFSIDVTGPSQTLTIKNFVSQVFDPTQLTLWRQKVAALHQISQGGQVPNDGGTGALAFVSTVPYVAGSNPKGIQVLGDDGNDYSTTYGTVLPYLTDDEIFTWFQPSSGTANVMRATVKAYFTYNKQTVIAGATVTDQVIEHQHTFRVVLCSLPSGEYWMKQIVPGEAIPNALAQALWTEQQPMQWKFNHEVLQVAASNTTLPTIVKPGKHMINLEVVGTVYYPGTTNPISVDPAWTTMSAVPQRVTIDFMRVLVAGVWVLAAKTMINCGPVNHLNPEELIQLANTFRNRDRANIDMNSRLSGEVSSNQSDLSLAATAKENSVPADSVPSENNNVYVVGGAVAGQTIQSAVIVANVLAATTPAPYTGFSSTDIKTMKPREIKVCDDAGNPYYIIVQATGGYTKPA